MSAGSGLVLDATAADVKWLMGSASGSANTEFVANGTSGAHCTISKAGSNDAYIDIGDENAGGVSYSGGFDLTYTDVSDLSNSDGTLGIGRSDTGAHHHRLHNCTFDGCGTILPVRPYNWSSQTLDFEVEDCKWTNSVSGSINLYAVVAGGAPTTGSKSVKRCSFD
jgi:hypothetical protein